MSRRPADDRGCSLATAGASAAAILIAAPSAAVAVAQDPPAARPQDAGKDDPAKAPAKPKAKAKAKAKARVRRDPPGFYMGRPIADVMSWEGADWLFRETRIEEEQPEAMLDAPEDPAAGRPSPTSAPGPAITASGWRARSGPRARSTPPTSSPRCSGCSATTPAPPGSRTSSPSAAPRPTPGSPRRPST